MMKFFKINASNDLFYNVATGDLDNKKIKSFANDYNSYLGYFRRRITGTTPKAQNLMIMMI